MSVKSGNHPNDGANPFGALDALGDLPTGSPAPAASSPAVPIKTSKRGQNTNRGRVDIIRQSRGGKWITVAKNFIGIALTEKQELAKKCRKPAVSAAP